MAQGSRGILINGGRCSSPSRSCRRCRPLQHFRPSMPTDLDRRIQWRVRDSRRLRASWIDRERLGLPSRTPTCPQPTRSPTRAQIYASPLAFPALVRSVFFSLPAAAPRRGRSCRTADPTTANLNNVNITLRYYIPTRYSVQTREVSPVRACRPAPRDPATPEVPSRVDNRRSYFTRSTRDEVKEFFQRHQFYTKPWTRDPTDPRTPRAAARVD